MSRFASGKEFEKETAKTFAKIPNSFCYKFPDTHYYRAFRPEAIIPQVPSDFMVICNGKVVFLECKSSRSKTSYSFDYIPQKQVDMGCMISGIGVDYYFLICNRSTRNHHYVLLFAPTDILVMKRYLTASGKKSIKWSDLERHAGVTRYNKNKDCTYDMDNVVMK